MICRAISSGVVMVLIAVTFFFQLRLRCDAFSSGRRSPSLRWRLSLPSLSRPCRPAARLRRGIFAPRCSYGAEDWAHGVFPHRVDELPFAEVHHLHAAGVTLRFDRHERALAFQDFGAEYALVVAHAAGGEGLSGFDCRCHVVFFHAFNLCEAASHCNNYFQQSFAGGFRRESPTIGCSEWRDYVSFESRRHRPAIADQSVGKSAMDSHSVSPLTISSCLNSLTLPLPS